MHLACYYIYVDRVRDCHRPQRAVDTVFPVRCCMQQHGSSHVCHRANRSFGNPILMMSICTTVSDLLTMVANVLDEKIWFKSTTVRQI